MARLTNERGFSLVTSVTLLTFAAIVVGALSLFIVERLAHNDVRRFETHTMEMAQSGIQGAVFSYRRRVLTGNGYFPTGAINVDTDRSFVLGGEDGGLLMVDTSQAFIQNRDLRGLRIQNATNSSSITIDRMIVSWTHPDPSRRLTQIRIENNTLWNGNLASPADADINDFALDAVPSDYDISRIRFSGNMDGAVINVRFVMSDGSFKDVASFPASNTFNFTVASTGRHADSNIWRTVRAEYNALTERIVDVREIDSEITP